MGVVGDLKIGRYQLSTSVFPSCWGTPTIVKLYVDNGFRYLIYDGSAKELVNATHMRVILENGKYELRPVTVTAEKEMSCCLVSEPEPQAGTK